MTSGLPVVLEREFSRLEVPEQDGTFRDDECTSIEAGKLVLSAEEGDRITLKGESL